jgi:hypothetical protein
MANPRPFTKPADRIYPVFVFGASLRGEPAFEVNRGQRDAMLAQDLAHSVNGGKALQLNRKQFDWNGSSCRPGELIFAYACDKNADRRTAVTDIIDRWPLRETRKLQPAGEQES